MAEMGPGLRREGKKGATSLNHSNAYEHWEDGTAKLRP